MVPKFEKALSDIAGVQYVTAVNSATSALHIALFSIRASNG